MEFNRRRILRQTRAIYNSDFEFSDPETDQDDLESIYSEYQESLYSESIQTVGDCSTLFEDSGSSSDKTEIHR